MHFATHGLLNSEHPELSGLVLSLVDDNKGAPGRIPADARDFNLRLPAGLVVLSACQTGLGKKLDGEGLLGLTRGFMYAGAARVVASLWEVNDVATAELMKRFYRLMLQDGMRPAAALRAAQIEMWEKPQWQSPFYGEDSYFRASGSKEPMEIFEIDITYGSVTSSEKERELTPKAFTTFLAKLAPDPEIAGGEYEELRRRLIKFFQWRGAFS